jgi:hypothetical protein
MPADWKAIEGAILAWVKAASGLGDEAVFFAHQTGGKPPVVDGMFITISLGDALALGAVDAVDHSYDDEAPAGEEITLTSRGDRELSISLQCFRGKLSGNESPRAVLSRVQAALALPSRRDALAAAGVSVFDAGSVRWVPELVETAFEARALLEVRCYFVESASEKTTFIEAVEVGDQTVTPEKTFTIDT